MEVLECTTSWEFYYSTEFTRTLDFEDHICALVVPKIVSMQHLKHWALLSCSEGLTTVYNGKIKPRELVRVVEDKQEMFITIVNALRGNKKAPEAGLYKKVICKD